MATPKAQAKLPQSYWSKRWAQDDTPWIIPEVDPPLQYALKKFTAWRVPKDASVLVPLCGNSAALKVLYEKGFSVTGIEFVATALRTLMRQDFSKLTFRQRRLPRAMAYVSERLSFLCMDIFDFKEANAFDVVYDRAALVALSPRQRTRYLKAIHRALKPGALLILVGFTSRGGRPQGPPFAISKTSVRSQFPGYRCLLYKSKTTTRLRERLRAQGVRSVTDYLLVLKKPARVSPKT